MKKYLILITFTILLFAACPKHPGKVNGMTIPSAYSFQTTDPDKVFVQANVPVPQAALDAINDGIAFQIERSHFYYPDWLNGRSLSNYEIVFIDPMATNKVTEPGSPALIVGTMPPQQAAGTCIGIPGERMIIVLPHQAASDWRYLSYLRESARNEAEHVDLGLNDIALYNDFTGPKDVHPRFP